MSATAVLAKHTAAGQYLGFALQPVRLCLHLLTCDAGSTVSLEHLDDVAIHTANARSLLSRRRVRSRKTPYPIGRLISGRQLATGSQVALPIPQQRDFAIT